MRQDSRAKKTGAGPKSRVARTPRTRSKTKVQASRLVAKKAPKREGSEPREADKRLAEALHQQAATDEILRVMSSSPGDVHPVLNAVAERATGLCDAAFAQVLLVEGNVLRPTAAYWADVGLDKSPGPKRTWPLTRGLVIGRAALDCVTIHHADVVPLLDTSVRAKQQELGFRAVLAVPLLREGGASGVIFMFRREPRPFSPEQIALVETFARQAVIAIENARLFRETKEALEQQTATAEILRAISSSQTDVQAVFDTIARNAVCLCATKFCAVFRFDGENVHFVAHNNLPPAGVREMRSRFPMRPIPESPAGRAILTKGVVHLRDALLDSDYAHRFAEIIGWREVLAVPMLREGIPVGVIVVAWAESGTMQREHEELLGTFADQAVIAIENVRLFKELEVRNLDLSEALERQTATSEILRVISQSPTDVQPVFDTIAAAALKLCRASAANVFTFDGELVWLAALLSADPNPEYAETLRKRFPMPVGRGAGATRAIMMRAVVEIPDVLEDPDYTITDELLAGGFRSVASVPLLRDGSPIGAISVGRPEPGSVPRHADRAAADLRRPGRDRDRERAAVQGTGGADTELTRSVGELTALGEVGQAISSTLDLETVLEDDRLPRVAAHRARRRLDLRVRRARARSSSCRRREHCRGDCRRGIRRPPIRKGDGALGRAAMTLEPTQVPRHSGRQLPERLARSSSSRPATVAPRGAAAARGPPPRRRWS